jgi:5-methyltetrahydrofolate--homocysteine methyltransferase
MTRTILKSASREVVIGFDQPFVMIGERINPTGRKLLAAEMKVGNYDRVIADALAQVEAGAQMLDVNAGIPLADEPRILAEVIQLVQSVTDVPLCIDSSIIEALEAGLSVYQGRALVNSTTAESEVMERVLPLVKKYDAAVVAISNDETGISEDPDVRFEIAKLIVQRAQDHGIKPEDVIVDPLVMPIGAINAFGLPNRHAINNSFLPMIAGAGMTCAILNPLHEGMVAAIKAADILNGVDPNCANWIRQFREPAAEGEGRGGRGGREGRRRRG